MVRSGSSAYVAFGYEATFGGGASLTRLFGKEQKANGLQFQNGQQALGQLYTPEVKNFLYHKNQGSCTMEYVLSNPFVLDFILNTYVTHTAPSGVETYTWTSDPATNTNIRKVKSGHLEIGFAGAGGNIDRNAKGVITPTWNLKTGIDQPISISHSLTWGIEDAISTTLNASLPNDDAFEPYGFVHACIELPDGTQIAAVQDLDLTFDTGAKLLYQMACTGNAYGAYNELLNITGKITMAVLDKTNIERVMARTQLANMQLIITNGLTGVDKRTITFTFTGVGLSQHTNTGIAPGELVLEDIDFQCRSVTVVAENATDID